MEAAWWHGWLPLTLNHWCLLMMWQKTEAARWILNFYRHNTSARIQPNARKHRVAKPSQEWEWRWISGIFCSYCVNRISGRLGCLSLPVDKTKCRNIHKEGNDSCREDQANHHKKGSWCWMTVMGSKLQAVTSVFNLIHFFSLFFIKVVMLFKM